VDDLAYFRSLLDDLTHHFAIDEHRIFATGLSNGGAMSHRLACDLSDRIAAIAPVGGGNQLAVAQGCNPKRAVPVLEIHGTEDPCWSYDGGKGACVQRDGAIYVSIPDTVSGWAKRNGCAATPTTETLPDSTNDGTRVSIDRYGSCTADVSFVKVEGGGHAWPGGYSYFSADMIGRTSTDVSANQLIWDFFKAHPLP
ncbi:MAG: alpha/beta hydrolase family esterase, partial [Myxococcaceae bacterium]